MLRRTDLVEEVAGEGGRDISRAEAFLGHHSARARRRADEKRAPASRPAAPPGCEVVAVFDLLVEPSMAGSVTLEAAPG